MAESLRLPFEVCQFFSTDKDGDTWNVRADCIQISTQDNSSLLKAKLQFVRQLTMPLERAKALGISDRVCWFLGEQNAGGLQIEQTHPSQIACLMEDLEKKTYALLAQWNKETENAHLKKQELLFQQVVQKNRSSKFME